MAIAPGESLLDRFVVETVFRGDSASLNRLEKRVAAFRAKLDGVSSGMLRMGAAFAAPLAGIAKGAITTDSAFRQLAAVGGFAEDQMRRFKEQAYEVGSALPLETAAILDTQRALVKLGFAYEDVLKMTPQVAKASVAAKVPIDEMAKFVGVAVKAFGLAGDEIDLLADQMVRIENISAASTRGVGQAFQYSAQIASDAGVRIEDYIAILGGMADAGREVEASSQGLGLFITNIQKARAGDMTRGAKMIQDVFGAIGISMEEVGAIMDDPDVGLIGLLRRISHATAGDMAKLDAVLAQMGGTSYAAALSAAVQNIDHIEHKLSNDLVNATGEAAGQVQILMQGISGSWEQAKAMLDTLVNRLADLGVAGRFEKLFMGFANLIDELLQTDEAGKLVNERFLKMAIDAMFWGSSLLVAGIALKGVSFALSGFIGIIKVAQALLYVLSAAFTAVKISATLAAARCACSGARCSACPVYWQGWPTRSSRPPGIGI